MFLDDQLVRLLQIEVDSRRVRYETIEFLNLDYTNTIDPPLLALSSSPSSWTFSGLAGEIGIERYERIQIFDPSHALALLGGRGVR